MLQTPEYGFSPGRAKQLGRDLVEALNDVSPYLRVEGNFWNEFGEEGRFVVPRKPRSCDSISCSHVT